jgi:eukaryotic-like serine/threonine-protein kinase
MREISCRSYRRLTPASDHLDMASWDFSESDEMVPGLHALRLLGGGRRYEAYLAFDEYLHALVVAKLLRPNLVDDSDARAGLAGEARLLARLAHPLLVRSFGSVLDGDRPQVVLEFVDGPRLSTLIRRYGLAVEQVLPLALNLCAVLAYLGRQRVVHLDVKPRNIIMAGVPRLIDLSVARRFDELPRLRGPVGTDAYMAPEQCDPERFDEIGPPADVWGVGATVYEALVRARPFPEDGERFPQLRAEPRPLPRHVPTPLAALVHSCLRPTPADRPTTTELTGVLESLVDRLPPPRLSRFRPGGKALVRSLEAR